MPKVLYTSFNILFVCALLALVSTLPYFAPENIFSVTQSRLQTPNDVLFTRLGLARKGQLTENDLTLRPKLASLDSRLLYFTYGPDVLTHCPFCLSDEPMTYFYYALPSIVIPHILHTFSLGVATSTVVAGNYGNRWRGVASVLGLCLAASEMWLFGAYDWKANARKFRSEEYVLWYWRMRIFRGALIATADAIFAGLLWLSSTNRMWVIPPSPAERTETAMKILEQAKGKLNAVSVMRNVIPRDEGLRRKSEAYWKNEGQVMREVMGEREVVDSVTNALDGRIHVVPMEEGARKYAEAITAWDLQQVQANGTANGAPTR